MEKEIKYILLTKSFNQLSDLERMSLKEWCENENEFNELKSFYKRMENENLSEVPELSAKVKTNLDSLFEAKYASSVGLKAKPKTIPFIKRPLFQLAAIIVLLLLIIPFIENIRSKQNRDQLARIEKQEVVALDSNRAELNEKKELFVEELVEKVETNEAKDDKRVKNQKSKPVQLDKNLEIPISEEKEQPKVLNRNISMVADDLERTSQAKPHSDGVYKSKIKEIRYAIPVSDQPELLDLLTASF